MDFCNFDKECYNRILIKNMEQYHLQLYLASIKLYWSKQDSVWNWISKT